MARLVGARNRVWIRQPKARDRAWQSMRMLRHFNLPELISTAEISKENVSKYVRGLARSGYLIQAKGKANGKKGGHIVWMLVRNTGPKAPRLQSDGNTYDPNEHKVYNGGIPQ